MQRNYIRKTGIENVRSVLKNLPEHHDHPLDAIRMIDRTIGGLLAHTESPFYNAYRVYAIALFPAGLEATHPGEDIILILNSKETTVIKNRHIKTTSALKNPEKSLGQHFAQSLFAVRKDIILTNKNSDEHRIKIPSELENPEKGVAQIIGPIFAQTLFIVRGRILAQLVTTEVNGEDWQVNVAANDKALDVLKDYIPYPSIFDKPAKISLAEELFPCIFGR